jgi:hypothetical protein
MPMPFALASGAVGAVERKLRRLVCRRIVGSVRLPASSADAADAGALGAGEHMHVPGGRAVDVHWTIIIAEWRSHHCPKGRLPAQAVSSCNAESGGWGSACGRERATLA